MRTGDDIRERTFRFACDVAVLCDALAVKDFSARRIATQLVRSSSSIGANLEEADAAQSRPDFISKCSISLKEARESHYWLRMLLKTGKLSDDTLVDECNQIVAILTTIVRKTRGE
ncbi:MAG TPA: four helix bundle protein [Candidatus Paceibacterota bacterium]|nr:four helix bundle protein [Candidatus Paceibacterota bacterium]